MIHVETAKRHRNHTKGGREGIYIYTIKKAPGRFISRSGGEERGVSMKTAVEAELKANSKRN